MAWGKICRLKPDMDAEALEVAMLDLIPRLRYEESNEILTTNPGSNETVLEVQAPGDRVIWTKEMVEALPVMDDNNILVKWAGRTFVGTLDWPAERRYDGRFRFRSTDGQDRCSGSYRLNLDVGGGYMTGSWRAYCASGRLASGNIAVVSERYVSASGTGNSDTPVEITGAPPK